MLPHRVGQKKQESPPRCAPHQMYQLRRNRQPQARAPETTCGEAICLRESLKDRLVFVCGNSNTRVLHCEMENCRVRVAVIQVARVLVLSIQSDCKFHLAGFRELD